MKDIVFVNRALEQVRGFPAQAKREIGHQLDIVQHGEQPTQWKPMKSVGPGVQEIRVCDDAGIYRVIYVAKFSRTVYVLHAFQKKTQKTNKLDLDSAKRAYRKVIEELNNE
jgi:phage-related protein